ncbi:MAG: hypothetical protein KGL39_23110, partial [Patescibacteria group bacterium]|nr:hypothetical protein [Patescibacteria group bacterium]
MSDATVTDIDKPTDVSGSPTVGLTQTPAGVSFAVDPSAPTAAQLAAPSEIQASWLKGLPEGYTPETKPWLGELAKNENPNLAMFKAYENQLKVVGAKSEGLKVPAVDAKPEEWQAFHKAIGALEKAEDYTYKAPEPPKGLEAFYQT